MSFRVPKENLDKLRLLLRIALDVGGLSYRIFNYIACERMSRTVAIRLTPLWTHAMFATLAAMDEGGLSFIDLRQDANADPLVYFKQWLSAAVTSHKGPCGAVTSLSPWTGRRMCPRLGGEEPSTSWAYLTGPEGSSPTSCRSTSMRKRCSRCSTSDGFTTSDFPQICNGQKCSSMSINRRSLVGLTAAGRVTPRLTRWCFSSLN